VDLRDLISDADVIERQHDGHVERQRDAPDRGPSYASNVLSFPYASTEGEIFLNVRKAEREAKALGITTKKRVALLLVHGCFHLKGYQHGDTMERLERSVLRTFDLD
jgi:probable rRNA maturation factor